MSECSCESCLRISCGFAVGDSELCTRSADQLRHLQANIWIDDYREALLTLTRNITIACALRTAWSDDYASAKDWLP